MRRAATAAALAAAGCLVFAACTSAPSAPPETTTTAPSPTPGPACIVGSWEAGAAQLQPLYDTIPVGLDYPAATLGPEASVVVDFAADGTFAYTQDVPVALDWLGHPAAVHLGGSLTGVYAASGDVLALTASGNELTAEPSDGRPASALFAAATQETLDDWPVSASGSTCTDDTLMLDLKTEGHTASVEFSRVSGHR